MKSLFTTIGLSVFSAHWCKTLIFCLIAITVFSNIGLSQTLWTEDWEGNWITNWHVDAGTWEAGTPTSGPDSAYNGQNCAATVLAGNYSEPVDSRLIRHTSFIVPPVSSHPRLRFWHWYSFSSGDSGKVQISTNGGVTWQSISPAYTNTGSGVWTYPFIDLSAYANLTVQIAFYFHSQQVGSFGNVSTGWYIDDIAIITGPIVFNNPEDFESGIGDWSVEKGTWEIGEPTSGPDSSYSPPNCAGTVLGGNYSEPVDSRLISPPFILPAASENPAIQFWHWYSFSSGDYGEVHIRVNNGNWQSISPQFVNTSSGAWTNYFISLSAFADSMVQIALYFHSHQVGSFGNVSTGWYVDEINILPYTVPVELTSFTSILVNGDVMLEWLTATETNNQGFEIQRRTEEGEYQKIGVVPGNGTTTQAQNYSYLDSKVASGNYFYRLKQIDFDGTFEYSNEVAVSITVPLEFVLEQNYPNPFNPTTKIEYQLPKAGSVTLKVYDLLGNEITSLVNEEKPAGNYEVDFNASNISSGVYFYKLQAGDFVETRKMVFLK